MPDFRVPDTAAESGQLRAAGLAAAGLWTASGSWCMNPAHLTDGWVPVHYVTTWPGGKRLAAKLVEVGLWTPEKRLGVSGWQFVGWLNDQRSAEQIATEKATNATRRELYGSPKLVAAIKERDADRCRYCARKVSWTDRRGSGGATFDHVIPIPQGGKNNLDNVVVACRGCNAGKGSRTPEQAGMELLPPPSKLERKLVPTQLGSSSGSSSELVSEPDENSAPHPHPHPSSRDFGGEGHLGNAGARPSARCAKHADVEHPPPCGACGQARRAAEAHDATADTRRALIAEAIDEARRDPRQRCEHGTDGGQLLHPDTGQSATCALCRRTARKESA